MKTSTAVGIVVAVIVIGGAVWWLWGQNPAPALPATDTGGGTAQTPTSASDASGAGAAVSAGVGATANLTSVTVTYGPSGFSPSTVTIKKGGTVTWVDQSGGPMWVASGVHPTHSIYDGTDKAQHCATGYTGLAPFDQCAGGTSYSFTFNQTGTWSYHNHLNAADTGTVIVQ